MESFIEVVAFEDAVGLGAEEHSLQEDSRARQSLGGRISSGDDIHCVNWCCHHCPHVLVVLPSPGYPRVPKCTLHFPAVGPLLSNE